MEMLCLIPQISAGLVGPAAMGWDGMPQGTTSQSAMGCHRMGLFTLNLLLLQSKSSQLGSGLAWSWVHPGPPCWLRGGCAAIWSQCVLCSRGISLANEPMPCSTTLPFSMQ